MRIGARTLPLGALPCEREVAVREADGAQAGASSAWVRWGWGSSSVGTGVSMRFNGATTLQPWIPLAGRAAFSAGNMLQWGHDSSAVDTTSGESRIQRRKHASMGPRLFSRGYQVVKSALTLRAIASMGPRLFSRGYLASPLPRGGWRSCLQWGHDSSAVDTGWSSSRAARWNIFNGATTLQPWILLSRADAPASIWYLQWGHDSSAVDTSSAS